MERATRKKSILENKVIDFVLGTIGTYIILIALYYVTALKY